MGYVTKYGSFWGMIPQTSGRVFWVAPAASYTVEGRTYSASDNNDGLSPERAVLTLDYAIGLCTASVNDVIVLLPGAHSWSASVAADVAGITITGLPSGKGHPYYSRTSITTSASDEVINVTAADIEIAHVRVIPVTTKTGIDYTAAADRLYVHDCVFDLYTPAVNTGTKGIAPTAATINCDYIRIESNTFVADGAQGFFIDVGDSNQYVVADNEFLVTAGTLATACEASGVTNQSGLWQGNRFLTMGTGAIGIGVNGGSLTNTTAVSAVGNFFTFSITKEFDTWGAGTLYIAENYKMNSGSGSGGALTTAIT